MSPVQTRSRKSPLLAAATTTKEMVLLKQSSRRGGVIHLRSKDSANGAKGARSMSSPMAIPVSTTRSTSSSPSTSRNAVAAAAAATAKKEGQVSACNHDIEEYEQRAERGLQLEINVCSMSSSSRYASTISVNDVVEGCASLPSEWWDEESCSTPKAIEFRIPEEACLACPPAPRKRKAERFHMHPSFLSCSPPLLPHYIDTNLFLPAGDPSFP